ncbi:hypothetical protein EON79_18975 [bacterium]|nr:MAG: hypothetical protein EON79_18975 [bacterium]
MALLVRMGSVPYYNEGGLAMPTEVRALLDTYQAENDHIGQWIEDRCVRGPHETHRVQMGRAFDDYRAYIKEEKIPVSPRVNEFSVSLQNRPGLGHIKPKNKSFVTGLALQSDLKDEWEDELGR